jgi:hypothetical protein
MPEASHFVPDRGAGPQANRGFVEDPATKSWCERADSGVACIFNGLLALADPERAALAELVRTRISAKHLQVEPRIAWQMPPLGIAQDENTGVCFFYTPVQPPVAALVRAHDSVPARVVAPCPPDLHGRPIQSASRFQYDQSIRGIFVRVAAQAADEREPKEYTNSAVEPVSLQHRLFFAPP